MRSLIDPKRAFGPLLGAVVLLGASLGFSPPSSANDEEARELEMIRVTGSRILRVDVETANPVQVIERDQIERSGVTSVAELLQEMSIAGASLNQLGAAGTSFGAANINLRNLGANRVLVLLNGRRWINAAGGRGFRDFVDLNSIPLAMVDRIEVLKDGASAVYGSDAIAGVVNIHTRSGFEGGNLRLNYGVTERGDGQQQGIDFAYGASADRVDISLGVSHLKNDPIYVDDRSFSAMPLGALSLNTPSGRFVIPGVGTRTLIDGQPGTDPSHFRPFVDPADRISQFTDTYLTQPMERTNVFGQAWLEVSDSVNVVSEFLYNRRRSDQNFSPTIPTITGANGFVIPADHPFNPWGQNLAAGWSANLQIFDNGQRINYQDVETFRYALGLEGEFSNGWMWDVGYLYAKNDAVFTAVGQIDLQNLALGIGDVARCASIQGCVPINIFGGPGSWTQAMLDWVRFVGKDRNGTRLDSWSANLAGDFFDMPAGPLAFAAGIEHRRERGYDDPDALINSTPTVIRGNRTTGPPREGTRGKYDLTEAYLEVNAPLLRNAVLADSLEVSAAIRHSDYSTFGSTNTRKFGLLWKPMEDLLIRGTFSEGFRSPSIVELFAGRRTTNLPAVDPCSGGGGNAPGCSGVPSSYLQSGSVVTATVGSNPLLQPEKSDSYTLGFVYNPRWAERLDISVDMYKVTVDDAITSIGSQRILNDCAFALIRCNLITRDASGEVINLVDAGVNIARQKVSGVDFGVRYSLPETAIGNFRWTFDGAYLSEFEERIPNPGANTETVDRRHGGQFFRESYPRWKAQVANYWDNGAWSANWRMRYIHSMVEASAAPQIGAVTYHDVQASYDVAPWNARFTFGINNLFDKQPPLSLVNTNINFDISSYDARGRSFYVRAALDF